MISVY